MTFEFDGDKYARASAMQKEWGSRLIEKLNLRGDERILDLGCGDGALTVKLAELVPSGYVLGVDASEGMLKTASNTKRPNLEFLRMNINALDFDSEFDVVFSNAALHWIHDHNNLLASVARALKPGGRLRFNFAGAGNCPNFFGVIRELMATEPYAAAFSEFQWPWFIPSVDEYRKLMDQHPFTDMKIWSQPADRRFPDGEELTRWLDQPSLVPFLKNLDPKLGSPFRDQAVERVLAATKQDDGTYLEVFRRINVSARRE